MGRFDYSRINALPFRLKLNLLTGLTAAIALLLSCLGLIFLQYYNEQQETKLRHDQIASVISANVGAALLFLDKDAADENLASVAQVEDIHWIQLFDATGQKFARYTKSEKNGHALPNTGADSKISSPVLVDGDVVGTLEMGVHPRTIADIAAESSITALMLFLACLNLLKLKVTEICNN